MQTTKIGIVGCGNISGIYLKNSQRFRNIETVAVADLAIERAQAKAAEYGIPKALTPDQLLADPDVEIVLNLTVPAAHAPVAMAALEAGKHVYNEKPLAIDREQSGRMLNLARDKGLRVGCAPDTFLGASAQTCREIIDRGDIGQPLAATCFMMGRGPEPWHPDPEFFYRPGGGPLLDMGPYYITSLVNLIGGVESVSGAARASFAERTVGSGEKKGQTITVETPTHISANLQFAAGAIATMVMSFDVWSHTHNNIEIYGTEGSLIVPDPNNFGGVVKLRRGGEDEWAEMPLTRSFAENSRAVGISDLAAAIQESRPHRASGAMAYHVLDVMLSVLDASASGARVALTSAVERPAALPAGLPDDEVVG